MQGPFAGTTSSNIVFQYDIIDGSDRTGSSGANGVCYAFYTSYVGVKVLNSVIRYVVNPFVVYTGSSSASGMEIGGNLIEYGLVSIGGSHCNMIETEGGYFYIHDNVIRNTQCGADEVLWVANAANEVDYVWNNLIYGLDGSEGTATPPQAGENYSASRSTSGTTRS
jgi:hypothetical protein